MKKIKNFIYWIIHTIKKKEKIPIFIPRDRENIFDGQVALITGGSGGIGKAIAKELLKCGCKVIITGTNKDKLNLAIAEIGKNHNLEGIILDIREVSSFEKKIDEAWNVFYEKKIDILINCAGINDSTSFLDVTEETYDKIMDINAKGTYFISQVIARKMIENAIHGHILNVSSSSSLRPASTPYTISKWAVSGMTKGMADVLIRYGIVVNAIAPGPVATNMVGKIDTSEIGHDVSPSGRYAMPEEVSHLAAYMVSGYGDLIVGDTFYITGGSGTVSLHR